MPGSFSILRDSKLEDIYFSLLFHVKNGEDIGFANNLVGESAVVK